MLRQMLEKLMAGLAIGVFGAVALFARVGDQPRLWDVLSDRLAPPSAQNGPNVIWVDSQRPTTRMMVTGDSSFAPAEAAAPGAVAGARPVYRSAAAAPAAPAKSSSWMKHINGVLAMFDIQGPATEHSSASASVASGGAPAAAASSSSGGAAPAASVAAVNRGPIIDATASVSYGSNSRSDIMSSGGGPMYNFSGGKK